MSDLAFDQPSGKPMFEQWPPEAIEGRDARADGFPAYDNPYSAHREPERFAAWRDGWEFKDESEQEEDEDGDYC